MMASCGAQPLTTLMKTANTASVLTNVSLCCGSLTENQSSPSFTGKAAAAYYILAAFKAVLLILDREKVG